MIFKDIFGWAPEFLYVKTDVLWKIGWSYLFFKTNGRKNKIILIMLAIPLIIRFCSDVFLVGASKNSIAGKWRGKKWDNRREIIYKNFRIWGKLRLSRWKSCHGENNFITEWQIKIFSCKDRSMGSKKFLDDFPSLDEKFSPKRASQTDRIFSINVHLRRRTSEPHVMCGFVHIAAKPTRFLRWCYGRKNGVLWKIGWTHFHNTAILSV